jgi:hypothetical protein
MLLSININIICRNLYISQIETTTNRYHYEKNHYDGRHAAGGTGHAGTGRLGGASHDA